MSSNITVENETMVVKETKSGEITITIPTMDPKYFEHFYNLKCFTDMVELKLFPDVKEITESFGCYQAIVNHGWFDRKDPSIVVAVIGDGGTPRTAATFAFRSAWRCISIDPQLNMDREWQNKIERLQLYPIRAEILTEIAAPKLVLIYPHSHASISRTLKKFRFKEAIIVSLECCVPSDLNIEPDVVYQDYGIWSPHRKIKIWKFKGDEWKNDN